MAKTILFCFITIVNSMNIFSQIIILGKEPQTVPERKKWILDLSSKPIIVVTPATLISGNLCNAVILSNPRNASDIVEGQYGRPNNAYGINFRELNQVQYTNSQTYQISGIESFSNYNYLETDQKNKKFTSTIVFYPGQTLYVSNCLESIQLFEKPISQIEINKINKVKQDKEVALENEKNKQQEYKDNYEKRNIQEKITKQKPFYDFELTSNSENIIPFLILKDSIGLESFLKNCFEIPDKDLDVHFKLIFDSSSNLINVEKMTFGNTNLITCNDEELVNKFKLIFKLSENPTIINYNQLKKISIAKDVRIELKTNYYFTRQKVEIEKKKRKLNIQMRYSYPLSREEQLHLFNDTSFIPKIRDFIEQHNTSKTTESDLEGTYYAKKTYYSLQLNVYTEEIKNNIYFKFNGEAIWDIKKSDY